MSRVVSLILAMAVLGAAGALAMLSPSEAEVDSGVRSFEAARAHSGERGRQAGTPRTVSTRPVAVASADADVRRDLKRRSRRISSEVVDVLAGRRSVDDLHDVTPALRQALAAAERPTASRGPSRLRRVRRVSIVAEDARSRTTEAVVEEGSRRFVLRIELVRRDGRWQAARIAQL
jgi:hypothetical protein